MAGFSLTSEVHVFACPNCRETINTSMSQCSFCGAPIDRPAAEQAAAATSLISQACSDASYLKVMAWMLLPFFGLLFLPFFSMIGGGGLWFLRFAIPFMTIRWWVKYRSIQTADPDFKRAKKISSAVSVVVGVLILQLVLQYR